MIWKWFCLMFIFLNVAMASEIFKGIVIAVPNNNLLLVLNEKKQKFLVKLAYIQTPNPNEFWFYQSRDFLKSISLTKKVVVEKLANDRQSNIIGIVKTVDGFNINSAMVYNGWALAYGKEYRKFQVHAKNNQIGIWQKRKHYNLTEWAIGLGSLFF